MSLEVGQVLPEQIFKITRADLVRYAGASGDLNPIHWNERFAREVGLPGVIAHGMYTMALAGQAVSNWAGAGDRIMEFGVRFTRPVPVPDDSEGASLVFTGVVKAADEGFVQIDVTATCGGEKILAQAKAKIKNI